MIFRFVKRIIRYSYRCQLRMGLRNGRNPERAEDLLRLFYIAAFLGRGEFRNDFSLWRIVLQIGNTLQAYRWKNRNTLNDGAKERRGLLHSESVVGRVIICRKRNDKRDRDMAVILFRSNTEERKRNSSERSERPKLLRKNAT